MHARCLLFHANMVPVLTYLLLVIHVSLVHMYGFVCRTDSRWIAPALGCMAFFCTETWRHRVAWVLSAICIVHPVCPYCESSVSESGFVGLLAKKNLISEVLLSCYWWLRDVVNSTQHRIRCFTVNYSAASIIRTPLSTGRSLPYRISECTSG